MSRVRWQVWFIPNGESDGKPRRMSFWSNPTLNELDSPLFNDAQAAINLESRDGGTITKIERV